MLVENFLTENQHRATTGLLVPLCRVEVGPVNLVFGPFLNLGSKPFIGEGLLGLLI